MNRNAVYLALFLIISSLYGITHYYVVYGKSAFWLAVFYNHFTPLMLLLGPLLYFYVRGTLNDTYVLKKWDYLHFIPAIIRLIGIIPYLMLPFDKKIQFAELIIHDIDKIASIETNYFYSSTVSFVKRPLLLLLYVFCCFYLIWKRIAKKPGKDKIARRQYLISLRWLFILIITVFIIVLEFLSITFKSINTKPSTALYQTNFLYLISGVGYGVMSLSLLLYPNILYGIPRRAKVKKEVSNEKEKKLKPSNSKNKKKKAEPFYDLSQQIQRYISDKKPFTNPEFSLSDIAVALKVPQNHVQYCINEIMGTKFASLRNEFRVAYAVELLSSDLKDSLTIEGIAIQSGFKTRASFYNAFKNITGKTPTEYIEDQKDN